MPSIIILVSLWRSAYHNSSGGVVSRQFLLVQLFVSHTPTEIVWVECTTQDQLVQMSI